MITVRYFGMVAEKLNKQEEKLDFTEVQLPVALIDFFKNRYSSLEKMSFVTAVNHTISNELNSLDGIEEIVLLPPFAGG